MKLIGLTGPAGAGKDSVRSALEGHGWIGMALADPIRTMVGVLLDQGKTGRHWMHARDHKEMTIPLFGVSYRRMAQTLGTEWGRGMIADDIWLRVAQARIEALRAYDNASIVISDIRFENDAEWIRSMGGELVKVIREVEPVERHVSEEGWRQIEVDHVIENRGTLADLAVKVRQLIGV